MLLRNDIFLILSQLGFSEEGLLDYLLAKELARVSMGRDTGVGPRKWSERHLPPVAVAVAAIEHTAADQWWLGAARCRPAAALPSPSQIVRLNSPDRWLTDRRIGANIPCTTGRTHVTSITASYTNQRRYT
ncbi:hypothetical protein ANO11243_013200 [Dothideomycetidae sp. 11243]|nr:hypothetical protein ANO11243_013200 [fungal sp. No.11243]